MSRSPLVLAATALALSAPPGPVAAELTAERLQSPPKPGAAPVHRRGGVGVDAKDAGDAGLEGLRVHGAVARHLLNEGHGLEEPGEGDDLLLGTTILQATPPVSTRATSTRCAR